MSTKKIHLLIPMSGQGVRYQKAGYTQPKPLVPVSGTPMIRRVLSQYSAAWPSHFVMAENHRDTELPSLLKNERPDGVLSFVSMHSKGPGVAILEGLKNIPDDSPVLVSYCDFGMVWDPAHFERFVTDSECDACLISYRGFHAHYLSPVTYAYSRMDGDRVVEVKEKGSFTENREEEFASAGAYYFRTAGLLRKALEYQMANNIQHQGEYYTSLTVQSLLIMQPKSEVRVFEVPYFFQWGTPADLSAFEFWEKTYRNRLRYFLPHSMEVDQVLMPMAGGGTRFKSVTASAKPMIPLAKVPMFKRALDTLPKGRVTALVTLNTIAKELDCSNLFNDSHLKTVELMDIPSGQALSVEAGLGMLESGRDIVISSCDHGIVLDPKRWERFRRARDCDAAIFTMKGFPGTDRKPNAFAYVIPQLNDAFEFPKISKISVKVPVSEKPSSDHLLVGTFWFREKSILSKGIELLKKANIRVNGELYLDSIFELLIANNYKIRNISLDGYLCWGDPDSLAEALYWQEAFTGQRFPIRPKFPELSRSI